MRHTETSGRRAQDAHPILEPIMIMFVGAMVGFIVISMYLPMFQVYDQIK